MLAAYAIFFTIQYSSHLVHFQIFWFWQLCISKMAGRRTNLTKIGLQGYIPSLYRVLLTVMCSKSVWGHSGHFWPSRASIPRPLVITLYKLLVLLQCSCTGPDFNFSYKKIINVCLVGWTAKANTPPLITICFSRHSPGRVHSWASHTPMLRNWNLKHTVNVDSSILKKIPLLCKTRSLCSWR